MQTAYRCNRISTVGSISDNEELLVKVTFKKRKCALEEGLSAWSGKGIALNKLKEGTLKSKVEYHSAVPGTRNRLWIEETVSALSVPLGSNLPLLWKWLDLSSYLLSTQWAEAPAVMWVQAMLQMPGKQQRGSVFDSCSAGRRMHLGDSADLSVSVSLSTESVSCYLQIGV